MIWLVVIVGLNDLWLMMLISDAIPRFNSTV